MHVISYTVKLHVDIPHVNVHRSWYAANKMGKHQLFICGVSPGCI